MAKLKASQRNALPKQAFGLQGSRRFPLNDKNHARAALSMVGGAEKAGSVTPSEAATIKTKAKAKLGSSSYEKAKSRINSK